LMLLISYITYWFKQRSVKRCWRIIWQR